MRHALLLAALLAVSVSSDSDEPASGAAANCPCAEDYAAAVAAFDARPGIATSQHWSVCAVPRGSVGKYNLTAMSKFDALTPAHEGRNTTIFLSAGKRRTLWGTRPVECAAWVMVDTRGIPTNIFNPPVRDKLSEAELAACETLIRTIAKCPEQAEPPAQTTP